MNELIKIESKEGKPTVNARELWEFLGTKKDFTDWIKYKIKKYGFIEGVDFSPNLGRSENGRLKTEYHITLDMAKELSMVENNDNGRQARQYFIQCEKIAKDPQGIEKEMVKTMENMSKLLIVMSETMTNINRRLDKLESKQELKILPATAPQKVLIEIADLPDQYARVASAAINNKLKSEAKKRRLAEISPELFK